MRHIATLAFVATALLVASRVFALQDQSLGLRDENVRILGRSAGDLAGSALAAGDVSGDGIADILIGVPQAASIGDNRPKGGDVALVLGSQAMPSSLLIRNADRTFYGATEQARLGTAVAIGDLDGDGVGDLVMGAPQADAPGSGEGAAYVFFGGNRLTATKEVDLATTRPDVVVWGGEPGARLGRALALGDFNGDGVDDLAVGGPGEGDRFDRHDAGMIYVFFGSRDLEGGVEIFPGVFTLMTIRGPRPSGAAGDTLAAGDVNGDGVDDLLIGVPATTVARDTMAGAVYVVFGGPGIGPGVARDLANASTVDVVVYGIVGDRLGAGIAVGDVNGDRIADLLLGAPTSPFLHGSRNGRAYAVFGRRFQPRTTIDLADDGADVTLTGPEDGCGLGTSVAAGDVTGDGTADWIVGAPGADRAGDAFRIQGRQIWSELGVSAAITHGSRPADQAASALAVGDVNGDDIGDLVMSSPSYDGVDVDRPDAGAVYVLFGSDGTTTPNPSCSDDDGDGFRPQGRTCGPVDCNDADANVNPQAPEICTDGIDNDCDGFADRNGVDLDGDGTPGAADADCVQLDCNDGDAAIHPGATETCVDGRDNDCNGFVDDSDPTCPLAPPVTLVCGSCFDELEDASELAECDAGNLGLARLEARRSGKRATSIKLLDVGGSFHPDTPVATLAQLGDRLTVSLAFQDGRRLCVPVEQRKRGKRRRTAFVGTESGKTILRVRTTADGSVLFRLVHRGAIELPLDEPVMAALEIYAADTPYRGIAELRAIGSRALRSGSR